MDSVNSQQYAPQYPYEMPPTSQTAPSSDNAGAPTHTTPTTTDPTPPRSSGGAERPGQFSRQNNIVNQQPEGAESKGELAELTQRNQSLADKYAALAEKFSAKIVELTKKISTLANQIISSGKQTGAVPGGSGSTPGGRPTDTPTVAPEMPAVPDSQKTEQSQTTGLAGLAEDISQLKDAFEVLMQNFNAAIAALTDKLNELTQLLSKGALQSQTPPVQSDTHNTVPSDTPQAAPSDDAAPETSAPPQDRRLAPANDSTEPAPGTLEYFKQENQKLEAQIDQMTAYFEATMSALEQQFETVTRQVKEQTQ